MQVKFTAVEFSYFKQVQGWAGLKARELAKAQDISQEAQALVTEYLKLVCRMRNLDDTNPVLLADMSGFELPDVPLRPSVVEKR